MMTCHICAKPNCVDECQPKIESIKMQVFIVMRAYYSVFSYDGEVWSIDKVFSTQEKANIYMQEQQKIHKNDCNYEIIIEDVN